MLVFAPIPSEAEIIIGEPLTFSEHQTQTLTDNALALGPGSPNVSSIQGVKPKNQRSEAWVTFERYNIEKATFSVDEAHCYKPRVDGEVLFDTELQILE